MRNGRGGMPATGSRIEGRAGRGGATGPGPAGGGGEGAAWAATGGPADAAAAMPFEPAGVKDGCSCNCDGAKPAPPSAFVAEGRTGRDGTGSQPGMDGVSLRRRGGVGGGRFENEGPTDAALVAEGGPCEDAVAAGAAAAVAVEEREPAGRLGAPAADGATGRRRKNSFGTPLTLANACVEAVAGESLYCNEMATSCAAKTEGK